VSSAITKTSGLVSQLTRSRFGTASFALSTHKTANSVGSLKIPMLTV